MVTIIAYDVSSSRRRSRIASLLLDYGQRVQYSVFECELDAARSTILRDKLAAMIDPRTDRIHFYPVCRACFGRAVSIGTPDPPPPEL